MELSSIILRVFAVDQELIQEVRRPTKHYPFRALRGDCNDSCCSLFFFALPQQLASHYIFGKPRRIIVDVSKNNASIPSC